MTTDEVRAALGLWGQAGFSAANDTLRRLETRGLVKRRRTLVEGMQESRWTITKRGQRELG